MLLIKASDIKWLESKRRRTLQYGFGERGAITFVSMPHG
jgi:hypothetical protein